MLELYRKFDGRTTWEKFLLRYEIELHIRRDLFMEIIGYISENIIKLLELKIKPNTPVFIGEANIAHIKSQPPYDARTVMF